MIQELLSQTNFVGRDGFYWWVGQVETQKGSQLKGDGKYKVRIVGQHLKNCDAVPYEDLPWAIVMMPATAPRREGGTDYSNARYQAGDWVIGFFLDGNQGQQPVIMGSLGKQYKSTTNNNNEKPESNCLAFTSFVDPDVNPSSGISAEEAAKIKNGGLSGVGGGDGISSDAADLNGPVNTSNENASNLLLGTKCPNTETNPAGENFCVEVSDAKCSNGEGDKSNFETVLTELFGNISNNGGQIGTQIVGKYTGFLYDYVDIAQGYVNKVFRLSKSLVARVKGEMFALVKKGAKEVIKFLLTEQVVDPDAPEVFNGPYANPEAAVTPAKKRVGRLRGITKWINEQCEKINCSMQDLDSRLMDFLENLIFGYLDRVLNPVACFIDKIVSDIIGQIESFLENIITSLLGALDTILKIIASPLNIIGEALAQIFDLLGITCGGPTGECSDKNQKRNCSGNSNKNNEDGFGLDDLIALVEDGNLSQSSVCSDSLSYTTSIVTSVTLIGGITSPGSFTSTRPVVFSPGTRTSARTLSAATFSPPTSTLSTGNTSLVNTSTTGTTSVITPAGVAPVTSTPAPATATSQALVALSSVNLDYTTSGTFGSFGTSTASPVTFVSGGVSSTAFSSIANFSLALTSVNQAVPSAVSTPAISYAFSTDKVVVFEGDSITFTLIANGGIVPDGTVFNYSLFGDISSNDIVGGTLTGQIVMKGNKATKTIVIEDDSEIEGVENVTINILETGSVVAFSIAASDGAVAQPPTQEPAFTSPVLGTPEVCDDGRIMEVPILRTGDAYSVPPIVVFSGGGYGASATAELDENGYLRRINVTRGGTGYTPSRTRGNCVISNIAITNPGLGYYRKPTVFVNGRSNIAEAIISDEGIVTGIDIIDKTATFTCTPKIEIIGGDGLGAKAFALMECRDDENYQRFVQDIAPSGVDEVIDCP